MADKRSTKQVGKKNLNLLVYKELRNGLNPSKICKKHGLSKNRVQYYLSKLRTLGAIKKVGYGTWEVLDANERSTKSTTKEVQKTTKVANPTSLNSDLNLLKSDRVRGHAFVFRLKLERGLRGWGNRERVFRERRIGFCDLLIGGVKRGQRLFFKGRKVHLFDSSVVVYEKASFLADTAEGSQIAAVRDFLRFVYSLERFLGANFKIGGKYKFRVSRQHYSLVKNALAKQYEGEKKKLKVYCEDGLWFLIDNSYNLHEAETVHSRSAKDDNRKVQDFFNGVKSFDDYTPEFVVKTMQGIQENQLVFSSNIETHITAIQRLGVAVERLTELVERLEK